MKIGQSRSAILALFQGCAVCVADVQMGVLVIFFIFFYKNLISLFVLQCLLHSSQTSYRSLLS